MQNLSYYCIKKWLIYNQTLKNFLFCVGKGIDGRSMMNILDFYFESYWEF